MKFTNFLLNLMPAEKAMTLVRILRWVSILLCVAGVASVMSLADSGGSLQLIGLCLLGILQCAALMWRFADWQAAIRDEISRQRYITRSLRASRSGTISARDC